MNDELKLNSNELSLDYASDSFVYSAKVKVSLMKENRKYFTKEYTNHGRWPLFYFLNLCLAGDYAIADSLRPRFINLFDFGLTSQNRLPPEITDGAQRSENKIGTYFNSSNVVSLIAYPTMSKPDVDPRADEIGRSTITFKFTVPFTQINLKATKAIEGFALYPAQTNLSSTEKDAYNNIENPAVYFFLTDSDGKVTNLLKNLRSINLGDEYNLYIEWILSITNQNTSNTTN